MRFTELLASAGLKVHLRRGDADVSGVEADSRRCRAGSCFVAVRGPAADGHQYIVSAVAAGGAAVVCEDPAAAPANVALAVVSDSQKAAGLLAQAYRGWPARKLVSIGVTGTKGKSTVTYLIRSVLQKAGHRPALLGTISYQTGLRSVSASNTTPGAVELAEMTEEMAAAGMTHLVMEVSSHALHQNRTAGIDFRVGVFTNLSGEHMDYHKTMEDYLLAKRMLFEALPAGAFAVINRDDAASARMAERTAGRLLWYGLSAPADAAATVEDISVRGTRFVMSLGGRRLAVRTPLIGAHNVYNCLAAAGACASLGIDPHTIAAALETVDSVPGRLQRVGIDAPYQVFVDYAHTDDALDKALTAVRPITAGRLIVVFGCGGDRDRTKRPRMARVAERLADLIVITSDNPRSEQPQAIIDEIAAGLGPAGRRKTEIRPDRREAIELAVEQAQEGDLILIAGKGHETYQIIGSQRLHFDDAEAAAQAMRRREVHA